MLIVSFVCLLETKVVELTNENEALKAKLNLMLSRVNMKEIEMEHLFEEEQRLGHICLKPATLASTLLAQRATGSDDDDDAAAAATAGDGHSSQMIKHKNSSSSETHDDDDDEDRSATIDDTDNARVQHPLLYNQLLGNNNDGAVDLSRTEVKTGNLLNTDVEKSPSPLTPSPSPPNESLLQILANQILKSKPNDVVSSSAASSRLLTIASPLEGKTKNSTSKRNLSQYQANEHQQQNEQRQRKWDEAAMTLLSLNKPTNPPVEQQKALQSVCQSVINSLLRKPNPSRATIDYRSAQSVHQQQIQGENFHHHHHHQPPTNLDSLAQLKTLMNLLSTSSNNPFSVATLPTAADTCVSEHNMHNNNINNNNNNNNNINNSKDTGHVHPQAQEPRADMMPLKLRMKMLNMKS
jgi:hypothetical protein